MTNVFLMENVLTALKWENYHCKIYTYEGFLANSCQDYATLNQSPIGNESCPEHIL